MHTSEQYTVVAQIYGNFRDALTITLCYQDDDDFGRKMSYESGLPGSLDEGQRIYRKSDHKYFIIAKTDTDNKLLWLKEDPESN